MVDTRRRTPERGHFGGPFCLKRYLPPCRRRRRSAWAALIYPDDRTARAGEVEGRLRNAWQRPSQIALTESIMKCFSLCPHRNLSSPGLWLLLLLTRDGRPGSVIETNPRTGNIGVSNGH